MAVIVPSNSAGAATLDPNAILAAIRGRLTLADIADSPAAARYAVSAVNQANVPVLDGAQITGGTSANVPPAASTSAALVLYSNGSTVESLQPGQAGADVTADHTSALTASLSNQTQDDLEDGTTYARTQAAVLTDNIPDLSKGILGKTLGNIADTTTRFASIYDAAAQTAAQIPGGNLVLNPSGALGMYGWGGSGFGPSGTFVSDANAPYFINGTDAGSVGSVAIPSAPGQSLTLSCEFYAGGITAGNFICVCPCYNSAGAFLGTQIVLTAANGTGWGARAQGTMVTPANTSYVTVYFALQSATNTNCAIRRIKLEHGSVATPFNDDTTAIAMGVAGSGMQIGDQRNLWCLTWAGVRSVNSASPITYKTTWNATKGYYDIAFNVAQYTLYNGGNDPTYDATSGSGTQAASETQYWYLFYNDPTGNGGAQTLVIELNPQDICFAGCVLIGVCTVTTPAAGGSGGSGGGSGGGGYCVEESMYIRAGVRAGDVNVDTLFDCLDQGGKHTRQLQTVDFGHAECVRLVTADGCVLECSTDTPFDLPEGGTAHARDMLGRGVVTDLGQSYVSSLALTGWKRVLRAHLGGVSYAAGADPSRRVYSHNLGFEKP